MKIDDEVLRIGERQQLDGPQQAAWCALVTELGLDPKRVSDRILLTRDDEHGYRLHLSIKATSETGGDILDRAMNKLVSTPLVLSVTPDQVAAILHEAQNARC